MYHFNKNDIAKLIKACECYKLESGSEFIFDQYDELVKKLKTYLEQNISYEN